MRTTLELPDELIRRLKLRAARRHQKLEDAVAQILDAAIADEPRRRLVPRAVRPVRLKKHPPLTIDDIEAAIASGRD